MRAQNRKKGLFSAWPRWTFSIVLPIILTHLLHHEQMAALGQDAGDWDSGDGGDTGASWEGPVERQAEEKQGVDADKVKAFVEQNDNQDMSKFTYGQLKQWFDKQAADYTIVYGYPRAFPFCVTYAQIMQGHIGKYPGKVRVHKDSHLNKLKKVFKGVEKRNKLFYQFENNLDSTVFNKTFVESLTFSRIITPESDMANLRQWAHITVKMNGSMVGLYMQSIVGPFGLPFGEFTVEFPCQDDLDKTKDIDTVGQLNYCSYRPKTHITHPSAYIGYDPNGRNEFHVHFRWFDITCMETPYVQFLMLIVKELPDTPKYGVHYVAQVSPVFLNTNFDSRDGSPYPYYPMWRDKMYCKIKNQAEFATLRKNQDTKISQKPNADANFSSISWVQSREVYRVQPNEQYDQCILAKEGIISGRDDTYYECPPGPLRCDDSYANNNKTGDTNSMDNNQNGGRNISVQELREELVNNETATSKCTPCATPLCSRIGFEIDLCDEDLPPIQDLDQETSVLTKLDDQTRNRSHGVTAMLAFLYFLPISIIVARFYKDVWPKCLCGNGPWLIVHIACILVSLAAIWDSMGPVIPNIANYRAQHKLCKKLHNATNNDGYFDCMQGYVIISGHSLTGLFALMFLHFVPLTGFLRPSSNKLRFLFTVLHSHTGYFTYLLGITSVAFAIRDSPCTDTIVLAAFLIAVPFIFAIALVVLDFMMDKRLGIVPGRKQWPILEEVQLDKRGPCEFPKLILFAVFIFVMTVIWILAYVSLHIVADSGDSALEGTSAIRGRIKSQLAAIGGIFGNCTREVANKKKKMKIASGVAP